MLTVVAESGLIRCPETQFCLRGARVREDRIDDHWRNVPGACPWVGMRVRDVRPCECGRGPWITTRQLRLFTRRDGIAGPIVALECPGGCRSRLVGVLDGSVTGHRRDRASSCPWSGVLLVEKGIHPPLFTPEPPGVR